MFVIDYLSCEFELDALNYQLKKYLLNAQHPDSFIAIDALHDQLHECPPESDNPDSFFAVDKIED